MNAPAIGRELAASIPTVESIARELGEENLVMNADGKWQVRAVDRHGAPDHRKAKLLREMFQEHDRYEQRLGHAVQQREARPQVSYMTRIEYERRTERMSVPEQAALDYRLFKDNVVVVRSA